ncbi:hypothetical protein MASR2M78_06470 [Treponema sp.]
MDEVSKEVLAKVKKLMALGESPSEAEAASALEKARTLLARYGLSLADVETHSPEVVEGVLLVKKRLRNWESHLVHVVSSSTFTKALHVQRGGEGHVLLIGREVNTRSAEELFAYLHLTVLKLGRVHSGKVAHLESFKRGVVQRIGERLLDTPSAKPGGRGIWIGDEEEPDKNEVVSDRQLTVKMEATALRENNAYIDNKYGKTSTKRVGRRVDAESYYRGRAVGEGVSLNKQLG